MPPLEGHNTANSQELENSSKSKFVKCNDFDDILERIGSQGKYQRHLLYAILCPLTAVEPILGLNLLFMLDVPGHWCMVPGKPDNVSMLEWKNITIPRGDDGEYSKCEMFSENMTRMKCNFGWEYDKTNYYSTIPSQFNWVCDKGDWATWCLTMSCVGNAIGTIVLGIAADKIGRKPIFFLCLLLNIFGRIISVFLAGNLYLFLLLQFITGMGFPMIFIAPCMICAEVCDKDFRAWIYSVTWMIWVIGMATLPFIAWALGDWFYIALATTVPFAPMLLFYKYIDESPRWLISIGKLKEAALTIKKIAVKNDSADKLTDSQLDCMLKQLVTKHAGSDMKVSVWTLFTSKRVAMNTTLLVTAWVMNSVIYLAITLNASNLAGNQFLNFFILAIIELPAGYAGSQLVDRTGRRWTQVAFFLLCCLASILSAVASSFVSHTELNIASIIGALIAKFAITLTFLVVYLQATEIYPTKLRSTAGGFASTVGSLVSIFTPYIVYSSKYNKGAPWFVMAGLSLIGMLSSAFLPETMNKALPETLEDAENFGKDEKFWSIRPKSKGTEKNFPADGSSNISHFQNANKST